MCEVLAHNGVAMSARRLRAFLRRGEVAGRENPGRAHTGLQPQREAVCLEVVLAPLFDGGA